MLREKYEFSEQDANDMADFLVPILDFVPEKRPTAAQCLSHPWITGRLWDLSPSTTDSTSQATENGSSEKKREKDEREAMEVGVGNIVIDGTTKPVKVPQSVNPAKQS